MRCPLQGAVHLALVYRFPFPFWEGFWVSTLPYLARLQVRREETFAEYLRFALW
jgi:hypothetical protein